MNTRLTAALLTVLLAVTTPSLSQTPLGTTFTYQGQLKQAGQPFNGPADLVFSLYDADSGGNLLGSHVLNGVVVSAGLFSVALDFGAGAFDSSARWLEVTVNGTPLAPRQPITAVPYALSLASGATIYGGANGLNALTLYHSDVFTSAIYALHTAAGGTALYGESDTGAGAKGVWGLSSEGIGVYGSSESGAAGVVGQSNSTSGRGVVGEASAVTGTTYGVYGETFSTTGSGVYGQSSNNFSGRGVHGVVNAVIGGYGIYGQAGGVNGYAVYASGNFGASGTKAFRIDHPYDPENKYLLHYSTEGPQPYNVYKGRATTDAAGYSWIELPDYFEEINRDVDYQLTVIDDSDDFVLVKVTKEIAGNRFQIRSSRPNVKVCWEVKGVRNDRFVRTYGVPVEIEKQGLERGTYQHPELYGQPPELGMNYDAQRERPSPAAPLEAAPR